MSPNLRKQVQIGAYFLLFFICVILVQRHCHRRTDGFSMYKIRSSLSHHSEWETKPVSNDQLQLVRNALNQNYRYLAKGAQCHAFLSDDGQYVLKFFRHHHMRPQPWVALIPPVFKTFKAKKSAKRIDKLHKDFNSYHLAYSELKDETGLVYIHLNKTSHLNQSVKIIDKIGIEYDVPLDEMEFLLQRRADLVYPQIETWIQSDRIESAKDALTNLVTLLKRRQDKGLFDKDPDLNTNFGFIGTEAVQIDVGRFKCSDRQKSEEEKRKTIIRITDNLKQFLDTKHPELSQHLQGLVHTP